jgi:DNA-binding GntR family transcriptional regulator
MAKKRPIDKPTAANIPRRGDEDDTVGETAYRRIRSDIVFGRLPPGQKLTLDRMKEAYNASVSTLREILNRLSSESLIKA